MTHLNLNEISNLIRKKCGITQEASEKNAPFFAREEQLLILARLVQFEETIKNVNTIKEMSDSVATQIISKLREEKIIN